MTNVNDANIANAVGVTIPGLTADGSTPLLSGLSTALGTFTTGQDRRAVVLLSDGYHNCPSLIAPDDPEVTAAIANANAAGARVYTIGFGRPADVDHPLLEGLAAGTEGEFYDVTEPGFDPATWAPSTALHAAYVEVLSGALGLDLGADPSGVVKAGQRVTREVPVCASDKAVTFYLSWATRRAGTLDLTVLSADGMPVTAGDPGVRMHEGATYKIITVRQDFLSQPGKVGGAPWRIEIDAGDLPHASEHYQYSVLMDSDVNMQVDVGDRQTFAGAPLTIKVRLTGNGKPLTGVEDVHVRIAPPSVSAGKWFAENAVSAGELAEIPAKIGDETLPDVLRKARFLADGRKVKWPARPEPSQLPLFDDGTHGDRAANDGEYANVFSDTQKEGSYAFLFQATGMAGDCSFHREARRDLYLRVRCAPGSLAEVRVEKLPSYANGIDRLRVTATPRDAWGNLIGPRRAKRVSIRPAWGRTVGEIQDNLDGGYSQLVETPARLEQPQEFVVTVGQHHVLTKAAMGKTGKPLPGNGLRKQLEQMQKDLTNARGTIQLEPK
jgi:hypothetical protein